MIDFQNSCFSYEDEHAVPFVSPPAFNGRAEAGIRLWIPAARELAPECAVTWTLGGMNIFGYGVSFSLPYFERMTVNGIPAYDWNDMFTHPAYGILKAGTPGKATPYYPCTETAFSRIEYRPDTDTFRETRKDGTITSYTSKNRSASGRGFIYLPENSTGPRGTTIRYNYRDTGELSRIEYEDLPDGGYAYVIDFSYEPRPDIEKDFRWGFQVEKALRCSLITVSAMFGEKKKLREVVFQYDETKGYSLLNRVTETAFSGGMTETGPSICISYQQVEDPVFSKISVSGGVDLDSGVPISLYHEGACGILSQFAFDAYYSAPVCPQDHTPGFSRRIKLCNLPAGFVTPSPDTAFFPFGGNFTDLDGDGEIEWISPDGNGYYEIRNGKFEPFTQFEQICPLGDNTEFADLYGDGKTSAFTVISTGEDTRCEIYRGLGRKGFGKPETVRLPHGFPGNSTSETEWTGFARIFGDGLLHRVLLRKHSCTAFPNLGDGSFGEGVHVLQAPDFGEDFDARRIRFADVTGSGTEDLVYVKQKQILIYQNISGAFFLPPVSILLPEMFSPADSIYFADFIGDLLPQLIFVKRGVSGTRAYSLRFPHSFLLSRIESGYGLSVELEFASSAGFLLADTAAGHPWCSVPPFHIPVVTSLSSRDEITGERNTRKYSYRDGRYLKPWRALYGFGTVSEKQTTAIVLPENVPEDLMPPEKHIIISYYIGDSATPPEDQLALIGSQILKKILSPDGSVMMQETRNYTAIARKDAPGQSFFPALTGIEWELSGDDPRITKALQTYDGYGNVTLIKTYFLPMRDENGLAGQKTEYVYEQSCEYINLDTEETLLAGIPVREVRRAGTEEDGLCLVSSREYYYTDPSSGQELPAGICKAPALLHHTRGLVFPADDPDIAGLSDVLTSHCGYCLENGSYYASGETYEYDADLFYLTAAVTLGSRRSEITYDTYGIFVTELKRVLSDGLSLSESYTPDYGIPAYKSKTDVNGNTEYYQYDAFGQMRALSYTPFLSELQKPLSLADLIAHPEAYMAEGADLFFYNARREWEDLKAPPCRAAVIRKSGDDTPALKLELNYFDGYGRSYSQAQPDTDSWIVSGKTVCAMDRKVLESLPGYSQAPCAAPVTSYPAAYAYDVLDRAVKVYTPHQQQTLLWCGLETEYEPWFTRIKDTRLAPAGVFSFRQDTDPRGLTLTDVYEGDEGDVLRSKTSWDIRGNIASVSDGRLAGAGLNNIVYGYDLLARTVKTVSADAGTSMTLYGLDGQPVYENSNGTEKVYSYDTLGRLVSLSVSDGDSDPVVVERIIWGETAPDAQENNLNGRIYQHIDQAGTVTYKKYDRSGNALEVERSYENQKPVSADYSYNLAGELTGAVTGGFSLRFTYSPAGRLSSVLTPEGDTLGSFCYTADGYLCSETGGAGLSMSQSYDPVQRYITDQLVEFGGSPIHKASYQFTPQGNLSAMDFETQGIQPFAASYCYDAHSRLIQSAETRGISEIKEHFVYDNGGNMVSMIRDEDSSTVLTQEFLIAPDSNRVTAAVVNGARVAFNYDDYGKPDRLAAGQELTYDKLGRLSSVKTEAGPEEYAYDAGGSRVSKTPGGEESTIYFTGNPLAGDYVRLNDGSEMLKLNFGGMLNTVLLKTGELTERFWQVTDQRESVILTMDREGNILYHEWFSPYGETMTGSNETPASPQPLTLYRFAGKEYDGGSGLYYFGARYYSPGSGRMLTPDDVNYAHLGGLSGLNLYAYCLENPESFIDSSGNWPHWVGVAVRFMAVTMLMIGAYYLGDMTIAGALAEVGLGIILGLDFCAITPGRATVAAGLSGSVGALIATPGDAETRLTSAFLTGAESAVSAAAVNYIKEITLERKPRLATNHPRITAAATTGVNAIFAYLVYKLPGGSTAHKVIGALGGGELGVVSAFYAGETGSIVSPKTSGNIIPLGSMATVHESAALPPRRLTRGAYNMHRIAQRGIIDFTFPSSYFGFVNHRVMEFNATEAYQWNSRSYMAAMIEVAYRDPNKKLTTAYADLVVIVHGGVGGYVFIDGDAPTRKLHPASLGLVQQKAPEYHTLIPAETLADHIVQRLAATPLNRKAPHNCLIKLVSCHGGEQWLGLPRTAQILANKTRIPVAGYDRAVSIAETSPGLLNAYSTPLKLVEARIFKPKKP